jgi:hypothetical protein
MANVAERIAAVVHARSRYFTFSPFWFLPRPSYRNARLESFQPLELENTLFALGT